MNCSEVHHHLFAYGEGKLLPEQALAVEEHIRTCVYCARLFEGYKLMESAIQRDKEIEPNPFAATRILQYLENSQEKGAWRPMGVLRPVLITLAMFLALALGFLIGSHGISRNPAVTGTDQELELLRSDLFISDFVDEDLTLFTNP